MEGHSHSHGGPKVYITVFACLLVLTVITVLAAGINFGSEAVNVSIALFIATIKATLVALFFMHLKYDKPLNAIIFTSSVFFLALFIGYCLIDVNSRPPVYANNGKGPAGAVVKGAPLPPGTKLPAGVIMQIPPPPPGAAAQPATAPATPPAPAAAHH